MTWEEREHAGCELAKGADGGEGARIFPEDNAKPGYQTVRTWEWHYSRDGVCDRGKCMAGLYLLKPQYRKVPMILPVPMLQTATAAVPFLSSPRVLLLPFPLLLLLLPPHQPSLLEASAVARCARNCPFVGRYQAGFRRSCKRGGDMDVAFQTHNAAQKGRRLIFRGYRTRVAHANPTLMEGWIPSRQPEEEVATQSHPLDWCVLRSRRRHIWAACMVRHASAAAGAHRREWPAHFQGHPAVSRRCSILPLPRHEW